MVEWFAVLALGMHVIGVLLFMGGIAWAVRELAVSLVPLESENAYLNFVSDRRRATSPTNERDKLRVAESA